MAVNDNSDLDLAIARVQLANTESDIRGLQNKMKSRKNAADHSNMNPVYKPKASPGPIASAANVRESRVPGKATRPEAESYLKKNNGTRPVAESTKSGKRTTERKSWRTSRGD